MLRVVAFLCGVVVGMALLVTVMAGVSPTAAEAGRRAKVTVVDAPQGTGQMFDRSGDPHGDSISTEDDSDEGTQLDLQGDEVTSAVARYRFDSQGNIYETHAPHTEVPHLGSPQL